LVSYCSKKCQRVGWSSHKTHCPALCELNNLSHFGTLWSKLDDTLGTKSTDGQKIIILVHCHQYNQHVSSLLSIGADPNATITTDTDTHAALENAITSENNEAISILIKAGAGRGRTLHSLISSNTTTVVQKRFVNASLKRFINAGTDIDYPDDGGDSPLTFAIRSNKFYLAECLIKLGANVNCVDKQGVTPLMWIIQQIDSDDGFKLLQLLLTKNVSLEMQDVDGYSALHYATERGNGQIVREIVRANANLETVNNDGETALILASKDDNDLMIKFLISVGSNINHRRSDGDSALDIAVNKDHIDTVRELVHAGVDVFAVNDDGLTVFQTTPEITRILCDNQEELRTKHRKAQKNLQLQHEEEKAAWKRKSIITITNIQTNSRQKYKVLQAKQDIINTNHKTTVLSLKDEKRKNDITMGQYVLKYKTLQSTHDDMIAVRDTKIDTLTKELESLKRKQQLPECAICFDMEVNCTLNCGHQFCHACANLCKVCPMCRVPITHRIKVFHN
jgi:ankyrin repeat protein